VSGFNGLAYCIASLIIFICFLVIFRKRKKRRFEGRKQIELKNVLKNTTIFSGSDIRSNSQKFEGGEVTAVFGGTKIDLRDVRLAEGGAHLELNVVFGGITLIIPQNMQ